MTSTSTNTNTMLSRSKLLDISDLNSYFTSSLFLLFGTLDGGTSIGGTSIAGKDNDAIITVDEDNNSSIISKYLVIVYQRIIRNVSIRSNTVIQLIFDFATTIYLGINSTNNAADNDDAAGGSGSIVLAPAAHLLGFGYKTTTTTAASTTEKSNSSSSNAIISTQRRRRHRRRRRQLVQIISYAFLRIVLPKLYEIMKRKGIDYYVNKKEEEENDMSSSSLSPLPPSSPLTLQLSHQQQKQEKKIDVQIKLLKQISSNRKKLIIQKIVQFIDTTIPIIRLSLLLSCWKQQKNQNANQYGGNLSMFLSGLSYTTTASSANSMSSPLPIASSSLFVLYAHRRWFHREFVDLVWNRIGRCLITTSTEINEMITQIYQKQKQYLLFLYKQKILSRYYKNKNNKDRIMKATKATIKNNNYDDKNENDNNDSVQQHHDCCQLCNTINVIIPYRFIDCCQQIVCYICLWNYVIEYNNNNHNNNNNNDKNNMNTKITIPCPICYQDIQHCQPA